MAQFVADCGYVDMHGGLFASPPLPSCSRCMKGFVCVDYPFLGPHRATASCSGFSIRMNAAELCRFPELRRVRQGAHISWV